MRYLTFSLLISCLFGAAITTPAQSKPAKNSGSEALTVMEDSLVVLADSMLTAPVEPERLEIGFRFARTLKTALEMPGSYAYPFARLGKIIHILTPEDKSFRIFNWLIAPSPVIRRYYGIIQTQNGKLFPLLNHSERFDEGSVVTRKLNADQWYGCAYYDLLEKQEKDQVYYFLFGVNTDGSYSNKKILDVLTFSEDGPSFGAPVFVAPQEDNMATVLQTRVILEYSKTATCSLRFNKERKMILFDRLRSQIYNPARKGTFAPTGQVDGFTWEKGKWHFVSEAIPILHLKDGQAPIDGVLKN